MQLIRGVHNLRAHHRGCVAAIGNFDGVHRGHRAVLATLKQHARDRGLPATVILFEQQPQEYFAREPAARLSRLSDKLAVLAAEPIARVLVLRFDARLASLSAENFIEAILIAGLGMRRLVIGHDFRFGHERRGDATLLQRIGAASGFDVIVEAPYILDHERVSSSAVRAALAAGDFTRAARFLGRPYRIAGRVVHGDKRGRTLGFPTANLRLHRRVAPLNGIFAVRVRHGPYIRPGVASIGTRPTFAGRECLLEVHLFDFAGDVYGQRLEVEFIAKLRDEARFSSAATLSRQMETDAAEARVCLMGTKA